MTTNSDPEQIRADIARTRSELSGNVDSLTDTANPKHIAVRQTEKVKDSVRGVAERIMGSPDDDTDGGVVGDARAAVGDRVGAVGDTVAHAPGQAKQKTRSNPLAAGVIAFGAGLLLSSLFPASQKEQAAVSDLQQNLAPLKGQAGDAVRDMADNLRGPAQEAVEAVRSTAAGGAQHVKDDAVDASSQVQDQAADAKETVQDHPR